MNLRKNKIVFIITDFGSFNNFLSETAVNLARLGYEIHVISSANKVIKIEDKFNYINEGIIIHNVSLPRGFNPIKHFLACRKIHKIINNIKPNIVSVHFTTGIFTTTFNQRLKYKTIGTIHGLGFPVVEGVIKKFVYRFVETRSMKRVDEVWVLNKMDLNILKTEFPNIKSNQIPTKGLGCDLLKFDPNKFDEEFKSKLRESLGISNDDFVIGFTGRYVTFKGFDKVVKSFKSLKEKGIDNIKLILIGGEDNAHPTGLDEEEDKWVEDNDSVINIGFSSKVQDYLSITDLFVFPSEKEGMPVCIIEALAMNVPVITANARGCNDLIVNNKNGILLKENHPDEIARQILFFKNDKVEYLKMKSEITKERQLLDRELFVKQQLDYFNRNID